MRRKIIILFLFFNSSILANNTKEINFTEFKGAVKDSVYNLFNEINKYNRTNCTEKLKEKFSENFTEQLYEKFLLHSSKSKNDLMSFFYCMEDNKKNITPIYVIMKIYELSVNLNVIKDKNVTQLKENSNHSMIYPAYYLLGFCLPFISECYNEKNEKKSEYKNIIEKIFDLRYELYQINRTIIETEIVTIKEKENIWKNEDTLILFLHFIPLLIIIIQIIFCLFPFTPKILIVFIRKFICCNKNKNLNSKSLYNPIKKIFRIGDNIDEIYGSSKLNSKLNNDSGIQFIIGIQGCNILFMIVGNVFETLIHSPTHIFSVLNFKKVMIDYKYSLLFYCVRYAPKMLFACSGFILSYKLLSYIEDKTDEIRDKKFSENQSELMESDKKIKNVLKEKSKPKEFIDIPIYYIFRFISYQIHKYFIFFLVIIFTKFSMYYIQFSHKTPIWKFLNETILKKTNTLQILLQFLLIRPNLFVFNNPYKTYNVNSTLYDNKTLNDSNIISNISSNVTEEESNFIKSTFLDYYWMISNEILFFIFGVFIIYFFYKTKNFPIQNYFLGFSGIIVILRLFLIFYFEFSTMEYLSHFGYGQIFKNPLFNFNFYLIGMYFGMINYIVEKKLNPTLVSEHNKKFLLSPSYKANNFRKYNKKSKFYEYIWIGYFIIFIMNFTHKILFLIWPNDNLYQITKKCLIIQILIEIFYSIDTELFIYFFFYISIFHFIKGNNVIHSLLTFHYWIRYHKLYYSYLVTLPSVSLFFLYQSESRISLSFYNIIFYSVIIWIIAQLIASFTFIFFEMPFKKLIKLLYRKRDREIEISQEKDEDEHIPL